MLFLGRLEMLKAKYSVYKYFFYRFIQKISSDYFDGSRTLLNLAGLSRKERGYYQCRTGDWNDFDYWHCTKVSTACSFKFSGEIFFFFQSIQPWNILLSNSATLLIRVLLFTNKWYMYNKLASFKKIFCRTLSFQSEN